MSHAEEDLKAIGRITTKKSGGSGYPSFWIYIPSKLVKHEKFPFQIDNFPFKVEIKITPEGKLLISKIDDLKKIIMDYGLENATLPKVLEKKAYVNKNRPFLYFKEKTYCYDEVNTISNQIANGILDLFKNVGLRKLKRSIKISLMLPNCPEFIFCCFGIIKAQGLVVPINAELKGESLVKILKESNVEYLIVDYQYLDNYEEIADLLPKLKTIIIRNVPSGFKLKSNYYKYESIISSKYKNPDLGVKDVTRMEIFYTSGTTGTPKGLVFRNYYVLTGINIGKELEKIGLNQDSIIYCPLPLFHALGHMLGILPTLFYNASIVIAEKFDPQTFWVDIRKYKITGILYIGNYIKQLINQPPNKSDRQHNVKWAFGLGTTRETWDAFENRFGISIFEGWTLTEAVGITINKVGSKGGKIGSVGTPVSGYEIKIIDKNGKILPPGINNIGQILARSTIPIPLEYYKRFGKKNPIENPWIETKDYGYKDFDGFFYYIGRESDIIHSQGEIFFAGEIENIVNSHPYVLESAAFSILKDNETEEKTKLCVVLKKPGSLNHEDLHDYISHNLASFMVPSFIEFKKELPKTATGFVQKFKLKEEWDKNISQKNTWDIKIKNFIK